MLLDKGSFFEPNEDSRHVVHAVLVAAVFGDEFIKEFFTDTFEFLFINSGLDPVHHLWVCLDLPYTIASHNNKIYVFVFNLHDVWLGGYHLLLSWQALVLFVLSVTEGSRKVQATIDSSKSYCASCLCDSIDFLRILWLMIPAELLSLTLDTSDSPRVSCICAVNELRSDQNNVSSASGMRLFLVLGAVLNLPHLFLNGYNLLSSTGSENHFVHFQESLLQSCLVVAFLVIAIGF